MTAGVKTQTSQPQVQITYGILDPLDAIVTVPYLFVRQTQGGDTTDQQRARGYHPGAEVAILR